MHRLFVEPKSLTEDRTVWIQPADDDLRYRHLIESYRELIRNRNWKVIDLSIKLFVKVESWNGGDVLVEDIVTRSDYYLASAYLKAGLLEDTPIIVFADDKIGWERLKPFRAVIPRRGTRYKGGAARLNEGTARTLKHKPYSGNGDHHTVAGDCLVSATTDQAGLSVGRTV